MKKVILTLIVLLAGGVSYAQTGVVSGTRYGVGQDSIDCVKNISFFKTYAKSNNYQDAYTFWKRAYDNCPASTKDLYIIGANILRWKVENAKDNTELKEMRNALMDMYDMRIKYFGEDEHYGEDYILANKVQDYATYFGEEADYVQVYNWLKPVVNKKLEKTDPLALYYFTYSSLVVLSKNPSHKDQYIKDHLMVDAFYNEQIIHAKEAGDEEMLASYEKFKQSGEAAFAASGAADCATMEKIYGPQLEGKKSDKEFLTTVVALLQNVRCTDNKTYYTASEYLYNIEPSSKAAIGIATKAYKDKDYARSEKFYNEAIKMSQDSNEKGEIYYMLAAMAYERGQFSQARSYANNAMSNKKGFGAPLLLIASMYASSAKSIYPDDAVKMRIIYCLVVDKASQAKSIDPSITAEANKLIGQYSQYYPAKEDVFMHPDLKEGQSFTVGGWINETTIIRSK